MSFTVFDPTDEPAGTPFRRADRPVNLRGKVIGLMDNGKPKSNLLLRELDALLRAEAGVSNVIVLRKPSAFRPAPDELLDDLARRADAVVTGIGD